MKRFTFLIEVVGSFNFDIEAETEEEARGKLEEITDGRNDEGFNHFWDLANGETGIDDITLEEIEDIEP